MAASRLLLALALASACHRAPPVTVEPVRLYVSPGLPGELAATLARGFQIADPRRVDSVAEAEVAWLREPSEAFALGPRAPPGSAPEQPRAPGAFLDPKRRYAPLGATAWVIVAPARGAGPFVPDALYELADPRLRGGVAMPRPSGREGAQLVAALDLAYGERATLGWLGQLARNAPILVGSAAEVIARVESGEARFGLADSLTAGGAAARGAVRVIFPDQDGKGCVVVPTAIAVLPGAGAAARKLSAWITGPDAESVLAERAPGLLPIREEASAPPGMLPVWKLTALTVNWDALAEGEARWARRLAGWPGRAATGQ